MVNDPISDMLTRIRNANVIKHRMVPIPLTKMSFLLTQILKEEGFIENFENYQENHKTYLLLSLKYLGKTKKPVITKLERVSKPGLRVYISSKKLPNVIDNFGIAILSTSKGVMTHFQAKKLGIGGEILCYIS
jgi:small subunit ribosomal protein S8